jgi:hypothetical protein
MATILAWIKGLFDFSALVAKYFPPKTAESKVEDDRKRVDEEEAKVKKGERPIWK